MEINKSVEGIKREIKFDQECDSCKGAGIYSGMGERDGAGVVCHTCKGKGWWSRVVKYNETDKKRKKVEDVVRVFKTNPGICLGESGDVKLTDFGGMPYSYWFDGRGFPNKSENRNYTCPAWWYQCDDSRERPEWDECNSNIGGTFSSCKYFGDKDQCWKRWDAENSK